MVDVTEILQHWYAGRPKVEGRAQSEGGCEDRPPVRGPGGAGMAPGAHGVHGCVG